MNELEIFDTIKIENTNRIDIEDKLYCEKHNKAYHETLNNYKETLKNWIVLYNKQVQELSYERNGYTHTEEYISFYGNFGINGLIDDITRIKEKFISKITYYFQNKYNVTIDNTKLINKYKDKYDHGNRYTPNKTLKTEIIEYIKIDYNIILDEIFLQLNGFSFKEKAIDEIKKKALTPLHYHSYNKYWNYKIKNKTIKFRNNINSIYPALRFFDNNETDLIDYFTHNKVDNFRSYDNGNTDVKFYSVEYALDFAKRFLGYIEMTEEEREAFKKKCS